MIGIAVVGVVVLAVAALLSAPVSVSVSYRRGEFKVVAGYLFFRFSLLPGADKPEKPPKKKKAEKEKDGAKKAKQPLPERIETLRELARSSGRILNRLRKRLVIDRVKADVRISREDAHQTALAYAKTASFLVGLCEVLRLLFVLKKPRITLSPDFIREKSVFDISLRVRIRSFFVLAAGVAFLVALLKMSLSSKKKQGKKSSKKGGHYESAASNR